MFQEIKFLIRFCPIGINFKTSEFKNNLEFTSTLKQLKVYQLYIPVVKIYQNGYTLHIR